MPVSDKKLNVQTSNGVKTIDLYTTKDEGIANADQAISSSCLTVKADDGELYAATNESPNSPNEAVLQVKDAANNVRYVHPSGVFEVKKVIYLYSSDVCKYLGIYKTRIGTSSTVVWNGKGNPPADWGAVYDENIQPNLEYIDYSIPNDEDSCFYFKRLAAYQTGTTSYAYEYVQTPELHITPKLAKLLYDQGKYEESPFGSPNKYIGEVGVVIKTSNFGIKCTITV